MLVISLKRTYEAKRLISGEKEGKGNLLFDYRNQRGCKELRGNFGDCSERQCPKAYKRKEAKEN